MLKLIISSRQNEWDDYVSNLPKESPIQVITTSPQSADDIRKKWSSLNLDVITISEFNQQFFEHFHLPLKNQRSKSELYIEFLQAYEFYEGEKSFSIFSSAYQILSDLRSFTTNAHLLESLFLMYPIEIQIPLSLFQKWIMVHDLYDEHRTVQEISFKLKSSGELGGMGQKTIVFEGIKHLNGNQVDLIKSLAVHFDVYLRVPLKAYEQKAKSDWINWMIDSNTKIEILKNKIEQKTVFFKEHHQADLNDQIRKTQENQNEMSVVFYKKELSWGEIYLSDKVDFHFKIKEDFFKDSLLNIKRLLLKELQSTTKISKDKFVLFLKDEIKKRIKKTEIYKLLEIKILQIMEQVLESTLWKANIEIDSFSLLIFFEIIELDLPRLFVHPILNKMNEFQVKSWNERESLKKDSKILLIINEPPHTMGSKNYPVEVRKQLLEMGPIPRRDFDLEIERDIFISFIQSHETIVLFPKNVFKQSLEWKKMFEDINLKPFFTKEVDEKIVKPWFLLEKKKDIKQHKVFSASRLQTYDECPQQYYYSYVEKISPTKTYTNSILPRERGEWSHALLKKYYENEKNITTEIGKEDFFKTGITQFLASKNLSPIDLDEVFKEIKSNVFKTRNLLKILENSFGEINWSFEVEIEETNSRGQIRGAVDLIGLHSDTLFVLDFKRSTQSIPTMKEFESLNEIQLWFYLNWFLLKNEHFKDKKIFLGYISMLDPEDSVFYTSHPLEIADLRIKHLPSLIPLLDQYRQKENELVDRLIQETHFDPNPKNKNVCLYCSIKTLCSKGGVI